MYTFEYNDLYLKCQQTDKYHMFIFDEDFVTFKNCRTIRRIGFK